MRTKNLKIHTILWLLQETSTWFGLYICTELKTSITGIYRIAGRQLLGSEEKKAYYPFHITSSSRKRWKSSPGTKYSISSYCITVFFFLWHFMIHLTFYNFFIHLNSMHFTQTMSITSLKINLVFLWKFGFPLRLAMKN